MERCVQDLGVKVQSIQWIERLWRSRCADTAAQNECTGIGKVTPYLLFAGEADWDDHVTGVPLITAKQDISLNKFFLPRAPSPQIVKIWEALSTAQPDSCLVYVTCSDARNAACEVPFQPNEESVMHSFSLTPFMHSSFLTAQWKVPNPNENLHSTQNQAARDGAAIVNQLHDLYAIVDPSPPSVFRTCHFSVQSDLQHGGLWVHWREGVEHYMELEYDFSMRDEVALETLRRFLRNILDNALRQRLESLKIALLRFVEGQTNGCYPVVSPAKDDDTPSKSSLSQNLSLSNSRYLSKVTLTPSSTTSEPKKPRKRFKHGSAT